jgi:hypothetical protein
MFIEVLPTVEPSGVGTKLITGLSDVPVDLAAVTVTRAYRGLQNMYNAFNWFQGLEADHKFESILKNEYPEVVAFVTDAPLNLMTVLSTRFAELGIKAPRGTGTNDCWETALRLPFFGFLLFGITLTRN